MARKLIFVLVCMSSLLFISCSDDDGPISSITIKGSGDLVTQEVTVDDFHSVVMNTVGEILLTQGANAACTVTVDDNIMQYIEMTVINGYLHIGVRQGYSLQDFDLTVILTMTDLENVTINGVATVAGQNQFTADEVTAVISGVGTIDMDLSVGRLNSICTGVGSMLLRGDADRHNCTFSAVIAMAAFGLVTDTTTIVLSGEGTAEVTANELLDVNIAGSGFVYYRGRPTINVTISGTGRLIDAN